MGLYEHEHNEDSRPKWTKIYMDFAFALSNRSSCDRASVGCVITSMDHNRVLAIGYNGNYRGGPNCCDSKEPGACGCLHAEENAIIKLDYNDHSDKIAYTTMSPCIMCAKRILNAGIVEVRYSILYRDDSGLRLLQNNGIDVKQF